MYLKIKNFENYTATTKWLPAAQTVENLNQAEAYNLPYIILSKQFKQIKCLLSQKYINQPDWLKICALLLNK